MPNWVQVAEIVGVAERGLPVLQQAARATAFLERAAPLTSRFLPIVEGTAVAERLLPLVGATERSLPLLGSAGRTVTLSGRVAAAELGGAGELLVVGRPVQSTFTVAGEAPTLVAYGRDANVYAGFRDGISRLVTPTSSGQALRIEELMAGGATRHVGYLRGPMVDSFGVLEGQAASAELAAGRSGALSVEVATNPGALSRAFRIGGVEPPISPNFQPSSGVLRAVEGTQPLRGSQYSGYNPRLRELLGQPVETPVGNGRFIGLDAQAGGEVLVAQRGAAPVFSRGGQVVGMTEIEAAGRYPVEVWVEGGAARSASAVRDPAGRLFAVERAEAGVSGYRLAPTEPGQVFAVPPREVRFTLSGNRSFADLLDLRTGTAEAERAAGAFDTAIGSGRNLRFGG